MTIVRRSRSLSIAVFIASASLLATQPALAGLVEPGAKAAEATSTVQDQQESMKTFLQKILRIMKDLTDWASETSTVTVKRS